MAKNLFTYINIINGVKMKIISESDYPIAFYAKPKTKILKKTKNLTAAAVGGLAVFNIAKNGNPGENEEILNKRESLIKSKIEEHIRNKKTITVKSLANELNIPKHLVVTSLYRAKSNIRMLFDKVKNTAYMRKPSSEVNKEKAQDIIFSSKNYLTDTASRKIDKEYAENLGHKLDNLGFSEEELDGLTELYKLKPALADLILFTRTKSNKGGFISTGTMKAIVAAHEINQELTEELLSEKKPSGSVYALRDIYKIVKVNQMSEKLLEPAKKDATFVYELATARMKNNKPRFGAEDILQVLKSAKEKPVLTKLILKQKDGLQDFRFNGHQIRQLLETYEKYPTIVKQLIYARYSTSSDQPENRYTAFCIEKVLDTLNSDDIDKIRMVRKLMENNAKVSSSMILDAIEKYEEAAKI